MTLSSGSRPGRFEITGLQQPDIVTIYDARPDQRADLIAMDSADGRNDRRRPSRNPPSRKRKP